ncbi:MAG: DNA starvation/stationary phase protection protein [Microbacteriaceae bacterium]|nr:DNA starvation/stationary phase protection protein [Microbacteriaceae bacterium]
MAAKKKASTAKRRSNAPEYSDFTVPGLDLADGRKVGDLLQVRLHALNDLQLTLKHIHWNVVGRDFIGVHEMLDPHIEVVRGYADDVAERMAALGVSPNGLPGALVEARAWDDYALDRGKTAEHLAALDLVYDGVIADHRAAMESIGELDPVTEDLLIGQISELEKFQWFVRAHLSDAEGELAHDGARTEKGAASKAKKD